PFFRGRQRERRLGEWSKTALPVALKSGNRVVALIGNGEVKKPIVVEVRDDYRAGIRADGEWRASRFRESTVKILASEKNGNRIGSRVRDYQVRWLCQMRSVGHSKDVGSNRGGTHFIRSQHKRR